MSDEEINYDGFVEDGSNTLEIPNDTLNTLRKYVASPFTFVLFAIIVYLSWRYTFTSINYAGFVTVLLTSITIGFFPVRIESHFVVNEFTLDDFVVVLGLFWLDPFQFALAFMLGRSIQYAFYKYSLKRLWINTYCNFYICLVPAIILRSPIGSHSIYFIPIISLALLLFFAVDTISFYAVCNFKLRENLVNLKSVLKLYSLMLGLLLGIPTCILIGARPHYAPAIFLIFIFGLVAAKKYNLVVVRKEQIEEIVNFMGDITNVTTIEHSEEHLLAMAKRTFKHNDVYISKDAPNDEKQLGCVIYSSDNIDHWLIIGKSDLSKIRQSQDKVLLDEIAIAARNAFEHKALQEQLFAAARHDALTGLYNRGTLEEFVDKELGLVKRNKTEFCLMFIDLDKFKTINDTYGHKAGDEVLKCIARRLTLTVRTQDVVARIGGDEFVILCRDINITDAELLAERISEEIKKSIYVDEQNNEERIELDVGSSIGISSAPKDAITFENLLKTADQNMYKHKTPNKHAPQSTDMPKKTRTA